MDARTIDDAGERLRELRQEEWEDLGLAALALGLAVLAARAWPSLALPLFLGGIGVGALGLRALYRRWDLVERLSGERDAYVIPDVLAHAAREATLERRQLSASVIRSTLAAPGPGLEARIADAAEELEGACVGPRRPRARARPGLCRRLLAAAERGRGKPAAQPRSAARGAALPRAADPVRIPLSVVPRTSLRVAPDACGSRSCNGVRVVREPPAVLRPAVAFAREAALVGFAVLVYFGVRGLTEGHVDKAFANARELLRIEDALGVAWELEIQAVIVGHDVLTALANWVYVYGHWPVIAACGVLLYVYRRDRYRLLRNAMIISGLIGFVFFAARPGGAAADGHAGDRGHRDGVLERLPGAAATGAHEPVRSAPEPALRLEPPARDRALPGVDEDRRPSVRRGHADRHGLRRGRHREPLRARRRPRSGRRPDRTRRGVPSPRTYTQRR